MDDRPNRIDFAQRRDAMVDLQVARRGIRSPRVLQAMRAVPREKFVPERLREFAYEDSPLPIGDEQTISQPYIVALMTEAVLKDGVPKKVLEIGTGSGYQAAVLAEVAPMVYSIERLRLLSEQARGRLRALGYQNIHFSYGDGMAGWAAHAPYDAIVVTAAATSVPNALLDQLAPQGRLVIPVGAPGYQALRVLNKQGSARDLGGVTFVPLLPGKA